MRRHNALFSKYGVSVRTHVHEGICIHWWLSMSYLNILLQIEVVVHNCILHDFYMLAATLILPFSQLKSVCKVCCSVFVCLCCVNSRWSTWVVRVGMPQQIFKSHSQISRLGMWTVCFPIYTEGLLIGLFF